MGYIKFKILIITPGDITVLII